MAEFVGTDLNRMAGELEKINYHPTQRSEAYHSGTNRAKYRNKQRL